jgi:hypothetical protein
MYEGGPQVVILLILTMTGIAASFYLVILSILNLFPKLIAFPLLFLFITILIHLFNERHRFKGFRS